MVHVNAKIKQDLQLQAPPSRATDALEKACKDGHPEVCQYLVSLEKHYEKLDAL